MTGNGYSGPGPAHYDQPLIEDLKQGHLAGAIGPRLRLLNNLLSARVDEAIQPVGLRSGAFWVMALIDANPGCSQAEIAREVAMDKANLVALIGDLEKRGLATRTRSTDDRRRNSLALTDQGQVVMRDLAGIIAAAGKPMRDAFSAEEYAIFRSFMLRAYLALQRSGANRSGQAAASHDSAGITLD